LCRGDNININDGEQIAIVTVVRNLVTNGDVHASYKRGGRHNEEGGSCKTKRKKTNTLLIGPGRILSAFSALWMKAGPIGLRECISAQ
jgi:hypothetical protein